MRTLILVGAALVMVGCSSATVCMPGASITCTCTGGVSGTQACNAAGTLETCQCPTTGGGGGSTTGGGSGGGGGTTTGGGTGTGGGSMNEDAGVDAGMGATIMDVTTGLLGTGVDVTIQNVVVMSQKFLLAKSNSSGSCLWALYVSAPSLTTTAANTGLLVTSYGTNATVPDGGTTSFCPRLGLEPAGDSLPDAAKPGDVLTLSGRVQKFVAASCSNVGGAYQMLVTSATAGGTAPVPTPAVLTANDVARLSAPNDVAFHDAWGSVKVTIPSATSTPQNGSFTDAFGNFFLAGGALQVSSRLYYRAALASTQFCHARPASGATTTFTAVTGFNALNFCTWSFDVNDKCKDLTPSSTDCTSATACIQ